jgi:phosphate transport system permease protein
VYKFGFGQSILAGGLTLGLPDPADHHRGDAGIAPRDPAGVREAAYALGATRWQTCKDHLLPYSMSGAWRRGSSSRISRAIGETAPLITIGALTFIAFLPPGPIATDPLRDQALQVGVVAPSR